MSSDNDSDNDSCSDNDNGNDNEVNLASVSTEVEYMDFLNALMYISGLPNPYQAPPSERVDLQFRMHSRVVDREKKWHLTISQIEELWLIAKSQGEASMESELERFKVKILEQQITVLGEAYRQGKQEAARLDKLA